MLLLRDDGGDVQRRSFPRQDRGVLRRRAERLADLGLLQPRRAAPRLALGAARREPGRARQAIRGAPPLARGLDLHLPGRGTRPDRDRARVPRARRSPGQALLARQQGPRRLPHADGLGRGAAERRLQRGPPGCRSRRRRRRARWRASSDGRSRCSSSTGGCCGSAATATRCAPGGRCSSTPPSRCSPSPAAARCSASSTSRPRPAK
jgi:hypothetical protein